MFKIMGYEEFQAFYKEKNEPVLKEIFSRADEIISHKIKFEERDKFNELTRDIKKLIKKLDGYSAKDDGAEIAEHLRSLKEALSMSEDAWEKSIEELRIAIFNMEESR